MNIGRYSKFSLIFITLCRAFAYASFSGESNKVDGGEDGLLSEIVKGIEGMSISPILVPETDPRLNKYFEIVKKPILKYNFQDDNQSNAIRHLALCQSKLPPANLIIGRLQYLMKYHELLTGKSRNSIDMLAHIQIDGSEKLSPFMDHANRLWGYSKWAKIQQGSHDAWELVQSPHTTFSYSKEQRRAGNLAMGIFTIIFSMVRRKGLSGMTEDILAFLWNHYGMSTLIQNFDIEVLLKIYQSKRKEKQISDIQHLLNVKNLRYIYYLNLLPPSMRKKDFMKNTYQLAQKWEQNTEIHCNFKRIFDDFDDVVHAAIADEAFTLLISDAIDDFERSGGFEDLDVNYLLLYVENKLLASTRRMQGILYDQKVYYEDGNRDIFDISLLPLVFRWSKMPAPNDFGNAAAAARELHIYGLMLHYFFNQAVKSRINNGKVPRVTRLDDGDEGEGKGKGKGDIAAQTVDPKTYTVLQAMLQASSFSSPISQNNLLENETFSERCFCTLF